MGEISKKAILVDYLKMCNKNDMAEAVIKYCDEEHGIVFNRHPAKNENKFGVIYDYIATSQSNISSVSNSSNDLKESIKQGSYGEVESVVKSKCFYKNKKSMENLQRDKEPSSYISYDIKKEVKARAVKGSDPISEMLDDMCEIIAPEGKGKFLKFIGENYVYVLLENGTYNCYPINMLTLNRSYLKTNAMYNLRFNYRDISLNHTRNILKGQTALSQSSTETILNKQKKNSDEFISFPEQMNYIRDYIIKNDNDEESVSLRNYLIHLPLNNKESKSAKNYIDHLPGHHNLVKKRVIVKSLNNIYKVEGCN
ncbi:hypothetical protein, conserved [Plasmodium gonderi]|uniref:Uncharacterized protein n=1 Tax=Plasmodium gonderi TaxID=77519 RepID=A0A1Y1JNT8_PLAGO|nr:hypothetical protein, conserved [Plasmodium gonderi]GAW82887.1 hypothetical protein, conserved [Plasmodium gonderi]